jgi:hypothetical protein
MSTRTMCLTVTALATLAACNSDPSAPAAPATQASGPISFAQGGKHVTVVTESDVTRQAEDTPPTDNWVLYFRPLRAGNGTFRDGPGSPPLGEGSFELVTPTADDKITLFNFDYDKTPIADFTALEYHSYQSSAAVPVQLPSINLTIDTSGGAFITGDFATLVFEPVYNPAQGPIVTQTWQDWDAIFSGTAVWWLTRDDPILGVRATTFTWDVFKTAHPNATILGGIGPNQGSGGGALTASVDGFLVGVGKHTTTYDFEACGDRGHGKDKCKHKGKNDDRGGNE